MLSPVTVLATVLWRRPLSLLPLLLPLLSLRLPLLLVVGVVLVVMVAAVRCPFTEPSPSALCGCQRASTSCSRPPWRRELPPLPWFTSGVRWRPSHSPSPTGDVRRSLGTTPAVTRPLLPLSLLLLVVVDQSSVVVLVGRSHGVVGERVAHPTRQCGRWPVAAHGVVVVDRSFLAAVVLLAEVGAAPLAAPGWPAAGASPRASEAPLTPPLIFWSPWPFPSRPRRFLPPPPPPRPWPRPRPPPSRWLPVCPCLACRAWSSRRPLLARR